MNIIKKLEFKGKWRTYQKRVLDELEPFLSDKKLNVVAAPGAGKTTLGIEVIKKLQNPVLILVPTITIKNQWKSRICKDFLQDESLFSEIATNSKSIKPITIITYQLLHSIMGSRTTKSKFISDIKAAGIKTIVLDEAHHLRTEWHKSLVTFCSQIEKMNTVTVSLTGTPPYDVSVTEWENYNELCGSVDAEISIPELVKSGDLAPHQDLIWFSKLELDEEKIVDELRVNTDLFFRYLKTNSDFYYSIKSSAFLNDLDKNIDIIYEDTDFTISIISFLLDNDDMDIEAITLLNFLALSRENIPKFDIFVAETLINGMIGDFSQYFKCIPDLRSKLKEYSLLESSKRATITGGNSINKILSRSLSKINSIKEITEIEFKTQKERLREVVLVDYIGRNNKTGVNILSVFNVLKNSSYNAAILSGTLVVIPVSIKEDFYKILEQKNIDKKDVLMVEFEENYLRVEPYTNIDLVNIITELFISGKINVLIGTQALLGEGWDAPCVNSLILGSMVGSFMLSNQMRGRAIRFDKNNPEKISNIWHLVCLSDYLSSPDVEIISRRFNTFEGISFVDNSIKNGLDRLGLGEFSFKNCLKLNKITEARASSQDEIRSKWTQTFQKSVITEKNFVSKIYEVANAQKPKLPIFMEKNANNFFFKKFFIPIAMVLKARKITKNSLYLLLAYLKTLDYASLLTTNYNKIQIKSFLSDDYTPYFTLVNCTEQERMLFFKGINELFKPATDNRYVFKISNKYIAIPEAIGLNKKNVVYFARLLKPYFKNIEIIYTRSPQGRKELLIAKHSPMFDNSIKTSRIWL